MEFDTYGYTRTPGTYPKVSYLVMKLSRKLIQEKIWPHYRIGEKYPPTKKIMDVVLTTGDQVLDELKVYGPNTNKKGVVDFVLWIPYNRLAEHENHLAPFLKYYFDGMVQVFAHYGVPEEAVRKVQQEVEAETIGNPEYAYINHYPWLDH